MTHICVSEVAEHAQILGSIPVWMSASNPCPHRHNYTMCSDKSALIGGSIPELVPAGLRAGA